jgi:DNA-binding beta-propeller fold protein YncE
MKVRSIALALGPVLFFGTLALGATSTILLPTGRRIEAPTGPVATVGTLPEGLALTRDGTRLLVVEGGVLPTTLRILDARTLAQRGDVALEGAYGIPLVDTTGDGAWVAGANTDSILHVDLAKASVDREIAIAKGCWTTAVVRVRAGLLAAACELTDRVALIDEAAGRVRAVVDVGANPGALAVSADGARLYVADWGERRVDAIDVASAKVVERFGVGLHPEALSIAPDGSRLFTANSDDDSISIVDLDHPDRVPTTVPVHFDSSGAYGNNLNALAISPDRRRLYASAGAANAIYVFSIGPNAELRRIGAIPTGWYPTAVLPASGALYVANGFGERSRPNPKYDMLHDQYGKYYIAHTDVGSVRKLSIPPAAALRAGDARVAQMAGNPPLLTDTALRAHGPIRHVIYIIKENRTYDEVFGDIRQADGDPKLVLFGENITPNEHAIARRFGIFDRTFCDAQVSADGHQWSTGAIATDYVEKMWQADYAYPYRRPFYDFESPIFPGRPHAGYLWDDALNAGASLRNYGEFVDLHAAFFHWKGTKAFDAHTDPHYAGYTFTVSDLDREAEWEREFRAYERNGNLPALEIIRLPNDHTQGTKHDTLTPQAYVAQNDYALGKLVDVVSHSRRYWASTAIFVIEDDAQDGPDHVDEHRTTFMLASPYAKGGVQHTMYTTAGILRTIELILGLRPMTTFDAHATPLYAAFTTKPDARPFAAISPKIDIETKNKKTAYRSQDAAKLDFRHADAVDEATMNDMLWHAVKGPRATPPPYGKFPD